MANEIEKKYNKAIELLKRWDDVIIPTGVWTSPGEDYLLPLDTQEFLKDIDGEVDKYLDEALSNNKPPINME